MAKLIDVDALVKANHANPVAEGEPLQVLCAGLSKTGTMSLYVGLGRLGYRCYHMIEVFSKPGESQKWQKVYRQELETSNVASVDFKQFYDGYTAAVDSPSCDYFEAIAKEYPDCKIILSYRDADAWWHSITEVLFKPHHHNRWHRMASFWIPPLWHILNLTDLYHLVYAKRYGVFDKHVMAKRIAEVREKVPAERLLVWKAQDGWEPLCKFLNKPIPDEPFLHINDGPSMIALFHQFTRIGMSIWAGALAVTFGLGIVAHRHADAMPKFMWK